MHQPAHFLSRELRKSRHSPPAFANHGSDLAIGILVSNFDQRRELGRGAVQILAVAIGASLQVDLPAAGTPLNLGAGLQSQDPGHLVGVDVQQSGLRIESRAAHSRRAVKAWKNYSSLETRWHE